MTHPNDEIEYLGGVPDECCEPDEERVIADAKAVGFCLWSAAMFFFGAGCCYLAMRGGR